jgi:glycine betaine transporter
MPSKEAPSRARVNLFQVTVPICALIAAAGIIWPEALSEGARTLTSTTFQAVDWFFMVSVSAFLVVCAYLALSRFGRIKLGLPDDEPEFSTSSWLAMLFAAGMGVGLLFWGVAEPMFHFTAPPLGEAGTPDVGRKAMVITLFHWGLHAWAVYCVGAMVLAYFRFRRDMPYLAGSPLRAAFKGWWVEPLSKAADLISVLAVAFGVAGSLAMGVFQIHTGLHALLDVPMGSMWVAMGLLVLLFVSYMTSAATSLDKGIKILSNINMALAILLMGFVLLAGPTSFILRTFVTSMGDYATSIVNMSLQLYPMHGISGWMEAWPLTYFIWWIAWAPFVGIFIARISRGRTIREFVLGVLFVPTLFSVLWFSVFGGTGLYEETQGAGGVGDLVKEDVTLALFSLFDRLPLSSVLSVISLVLVFIFAVTSVDSATFVLGMLTSKGSMNPPTRRKLAWGILLAALGAALIIAGNIDVVRAVSISGALPFALVLILQVAALFKALFEDQHTTPELQDDPPPPPARAVLQPPANEDKEVAA